MFWFLKVKKTPNLNVDSTQHIPDAFLTRWKGVLKKRGRPDPVLYEKKTREP